MTASPAPISAPSDNGLHIVLYQPQIPPNTGTIGRMCVASTTPLHLIEPLGFSLDDKHLKRAGLDYWPDVDLHVWPDFRAYLDHCPGRRIIPTSARRGRPYHLFDFAPGDSLIFGPEDNGLPEEIHGAYPDQITIPFWGKVRSLNLSTAAGILAYEFFRQTGRLDSK